MIIKCTYGYVIHLFKPFHHLHQYGTVKKKNCNSIWIVISELVFNNSPQSYVTTSICALWQFCFSDVRCNCIFDEGFGSQERSDRNLQCIYLFIYLSIPFFCNLGNPFSALARSSWEPMAQGYTYIQHKYNMKYLNIYIGIKWILNTYTIRD